MKKRILLALLAALMLCGCSSAPEQTQPHQAIQSQPVTEPEVTELPTAAVQYVDLVLQVTDESIWSDQDQVDALLAEFNAYYPNILVQVEHGDCAEANLILGSGTQLQNLYRQGRLADVTDLWADLEEDLYPVVADQCSDAGHRFALPLAVNVYCMAIRTDLFQNAQADSLVNTTTHTWSAGSFLQAADNLTQLGIDPVLSIYCANTDGDVFTRLLVENLQGGKYVNPINGTYLANSTQIVNALKQLRETPGLFRPDMTASDALEQFLAGQSAMVLNWSSRLQLQYGSDKPVVHMLYPSNARTKTYCDVYALAVMDSADPQKLAASMTLAAFLNGSDEAIRCTGQLPARKSDVKIYKDTPLEEAMDSLSGLLYYMEPGEIPGSNWDMGREAWAELLRSIAEEDSDVDVCVEACQEKLAPQP